MKYIIRCIDKKGRLFGYYCENKSWGFVSRRYATHLTHKEARAIRDKLYHLYCNDRYFVLQTVDK